MSISWRNKLSLASVLFFVLGISLPVFGAGPINAIFVLGNSGTYMVGVSTNSPSSADIYVAVNSSGTPPDNGQIITTALLDGGGTPILGGMSPTSITTQGSNTIYGGSPGLYVPMTFFRAGSVTVRASSNGFTATKAITVNRGPANKIVVLAEGLGMAHTPGQDPAFFTGYSGAATNGQPNQPITLRVLLTDVGFNIITSTSGGSVSLLSSVPQVTITPPSQAWVNGEATFTAVINEAHVNKQLTFTTTGMGSIANGTIDIAMGGPEPESVLPYPSPFNPSQGPIKFQYNLNDPKEVGITVKDQFGQDVWRYRGSSGAGVSEVAWDGRNERGSVVAAGVYYVLLDVGGEIKSKRRFGVVK